jgi:UDP-N-acetylglucosamine diphosphorylase / glucose-1-phosphate thymidylyltransferase / UDP-N-acetylgalactosamine diphosphorylase / glucosamine-1-phosphate N-acetyltransferase / galactosamine-1-phosphate N-acetyltransferase
MWWNELGIQQSALAQLRRNISPVADVSPDAMLLGDVVVGAGTRICGGAVIQGPVRIGRDCLIGNNAFIRGATVIGDGCRIGYATELKQARLGRDVTVGPQCFVADSLVDDRAYLGALVRTSNHRLDGACVKVMQDGALLDTQLDKLGAWIGADAALGVAVIILPGRVVAPGTQLGPRVTVEKNLPPGRYRLAQQLHFSSPQE